MLLSTTMTTGCLYRAGSSLSAGLLDEVAGKGESGGIEAVTDRLVEKAVVKKLGEQLSTGVMAGVGEISPEQRKSLEDTVEGVIIVATKRAGSGIRDEISPQLREMVKQDIVNALVEGFRGDLGDSMEETVAKVVQAAMIGVRGHLEDQELRATVGEMIRDSFYIAMREGGKTPDGDARPAVAETLETTLSENMLKPFESSVDGLADRVASKVDENNQKLEQMMQGVISALVVILGVFILLYSLTRRQLLRAREKGDKDREAARALGAAVQLLGDDVRTEVLGTAEGFAGQKIDLPTRPGGHRVEAPRSDGYLRAEEDFKEGEDDDPYSR